MDEAVARARSRLSRVRMLSWGLVAFSVGCVLALIAFLTLRLATGAPPAPWLLLLPVAAGVLGALVATLARRPRPLDAALLLDRGLGLDERLSSAVWCAGDRAHTEVAPSIRSAVERDAAARVAGIGRERLRKLLPLPRPGVPCASAAVLGLAFALVPLLPAPASPHAPPSREAQKEAQQVREAARRLGQRAAELERIAAVRRLEAARRAARRTAEEARKLTTEGHDRRSGLAKLSRLRAGATKERDALMGVRGKDDPFGVEETASELARLARALDDLDPRGLSLDLEELRATLGDEAAAARAEERTPRVDVADLEDLVERIGRAGAALDELEQKLKDSPRLQERIGELSARQREILRRLQKKLDRFAGL